MSKSYGALAISLFRSLILAILSGGFWNKDCERAIVWNDPTIAIHWPLERLEGTEVSLSGKDADAIGFAEAQASGDVFP